MTWNEHHPAMLRRTGGLRATGSPSDFPTAAELEAAMALDDLVHEINLKHDDFFDRLAFAVDQRLTRMHIEAMSTTDWHPNDYAINLTPIFGGSQ